MPKLRKASAQVIVDSSGPIHRKRKSNMPVAATKIMAAEKVYQNIVTKSDYYCKNKIKSRFILTKIQLSLGVIENTVKIIFGISNTSTSRGHRTEKRKA